MDVPWPPPSPPLSPTEEAQQLVKMMMCAGFDERGVTYDEAVGPPPPPYSPRSPPPTRTTPRRTRTRLAGDDSGDEILQVGPSASRRTGRRTRPRTTAGRAKYRVRAPTGTPSPRDVAPTAFGNN